MVVAICTGVAPFVGAWIEIILNQLLRLVNKSLRSSERGLKLLLSVVSTSLMWSLRSSERGLKSR